MEPVRPATREEIAAVDDVLHGLREHFKEWRGYEGNEHGLIAFAFYEGVGGSSCCSDILVRAAGPALGRRLVEKHGFEWVMIQTNGQWSLGVRHSKLKEPIDLSTLENGRWNRCRYDEPPHPGMITHDSYEFIVAQSGGRVPDQ